MKFKPGDIITDGMSLLDYSLYAHINSSDLTLYNISWKINGDEFIEGYNIESEDSFNILLTNIFRPLID